MQVKIKQLYINLANLINCSLDFSDVLKLYVYNFL